MSNLNYGPETEPSRQISPILLRSLSLKAENNLVDFFIVIIDALMETSNDCQLLINDLRNMVNDTVHDFNSLDSSLTFIQANEEGKIFLIISGCFGEKHGHHLFELPQIECIYVFCHDRPKHENWAHAVQKIRGVFEDKTQLLTTVCREVKNFASRWSFLGESSFQKASTNDGRWYQLFIRALIHQPRTENTWKEMLNEFRSFYRQNTKVLDKINEFETNYTADQAIKYYCEDSFIYRIINCALRTHDIDIIIRFQPYISDLYDELKKKYLRYNIDFRMRKTGLPVRVVYRGQYMQEAELEKLKVYCQSRNSRIVLNTFGSATRDPKVAMQFIPDYCPGYVRCLYQIIIPDHHYTTDGISSIFCHQFVDIADQAADEQEVLFSVGSLFRIKYIGQSTLERSWVSIVLELYADTQGIDSCWNVFSRRIQAESDEMKTELLHFMQKYTKKGNELNWVKWWEHLERVGVIRKRDDEFLVMIMYEGFDDPESIAKAIELRKRSFMANNPSMFQSAENSLGLFLKEMKIRKPTRIIALYELLLSSNGISNWLQYDFDNVVEAYERAGDAYANFHFYAENALNCYRKASELAKRNSDDQATDRLECKITKLSSETSVTNFGHHTEVSKKERTITRCSSSEYEAQLVKMADYETEYDQWSILWQFHKASRGDNLSTRAKKRRRFLHLYISEREKWIDSCDLRIFLSMPVQQRQKIDSPSDICPFLFLAVWSHLNEHVFNLGDYTLNLWRYEKFMLEWLSLNDIKKILTFYRCTDPTYDVSILDRLIEKLKLIVIGCTLMISVSPKRGTDCFAVDVNRINFVEVGRANVPKLVFFDDRDEITKDTVRAELETFAH